jgi:hypothetical protein
MLALAVERPALDGELAHIEVGLMLQHGIQNATQPMCDCHHRHFVAVLGGKFAEVRIERMIAVGGVVCCFARHVAQLGRALLGDLAVPIARSWSVEGTKPAKLAARLAVAKRRTSENTATAVSATIGPTLGTV